MADTEAGQMEDHLNSLHDTFNIKRISYGTLEKIKIFIVQVVGYVFEFSINQIINNPHSAATIHEFVYKMRAYEASTSCDKALQCVNLHRTSFKVS